MKAVTVDQAMAWEPCGHDGEEGGHNYTRRRVEELFAGRGRLMAEEIATLAIPAEDRLWALLHPEFLTEQQIHLLACDFAEQVVHLCGDDPRPRAAIEAKRQWVRREISDQELAAARDASWAAAWATAVDWQINRILRYIQDEETERLT